MSRKRITLEKKSAKPLHDQIYEAVRNDLLAGLYKTGQKMPTTPKLLVRYKVNSSTLQRSMNRLVKEGYIERSPRRGTFVKHKPQGARIAVFSGPNLLNPDAEFGRLMVQQLKESAASFGWSLEIFDAVGQQTPGHLKKTAANFRDEFQQHPFRGVIELNINTQAKALTSDSDNLYDSGIGPQAGAQVVELDVAHMASTCMADFAKNKVKTLYAIRSNGGVPFAASEKAALKKAAKTNSITIKFIDLSSKQSADADAVQSFHHAKAALKASRKGTGFLCGSLAVAQGIADASLQAGEQPTATLVSTQPNAPNHLIPFGCYEFASADIAEAMLNNLDEKMHANSIEEPKPIQGKFTAAGKVSKAPPETNLKKSWKA